MTQSSAPPCASRGRHVDAIALDIRSEVDRVVAALSSPPASHVSQTKRGPGLSISAETIYMRAMAIVDEQGTDALTIRSLAADLHISTRTLYKRIASRDNLLRHIAANFADRLDLSIQVTESWRSTALAWCLQLRESMTVHPHLSNLLGDEVIENFTEHVDDLVRLAVHKGLSRPRATACLRSLVRVTMNDARAEIRILLSEAAEDDRRRAARESDFINTISLLLDGVQERSRASAPMTSSGPECGRSEPAPDRSPLAKMDRAGLVSFAWALLDAAKPHLRDDVRVWLYTKIGAGELEGAILDLLRGFERNGAVFPDTVSDQVQQWVNGYAGSDSEPLLRSLVDRIRPA